MDEPGCGGIVRAENAILRGGEGDAVGSNSEG